MRTCVISLVLIMLFIVFPTPQTARDSIAVSNVLFPNSKLIVETPYAMNTFVDVVLYTVYGPIRTAAKIYVPEYGEFTLQDLFPLLAKYTKFAVVLGITSPRASRHIITDLDGISDGKYATVNGFVPSSVEFEFLSKTRLGDAYVGKLQIAVQKNIEDIQSSVYSELYAVDVRINATGTLTDSYFIINHINVRSIKVTTKEGDLRIGLSYIGDVGLARKVYRYGSTAKIVVTLYRDCTSYIPLSMSSKEVYVSDVAPGDEITINTTVRVSITSNRPYQPLHNAYLAYVSPLSGMKYVKLVGTAYDLTTEVMKVSISGPGVSTVINDFSGVILANVAYGHTTITLIGVLDGEAIRYVYHSDVEAYAFELHGSLAVLSYSLPSVPRIRRSPCFSPMKHPSCRRSRRYGEPFAGTSARRSSTRRANSPHGSAWNSSWTTSGSSNRSNSASCRRCTSRSQAMA